MHELQPAHLQASPSPDEQRPRPALPGAYAAPSFHPARRRGPVSSLPCNLCHRTRATSAANKPQTGSSAPYSGRASEARRALALSRPLPYARPPALDLQCLWGLVVRRRRSLNSALDSPPASVKGRRAKPASTPAASLLVAGAGRGRRWRRWALRCGPCVRSCASFAKRAVGPAAPTATPPPTATSSRPSAPTGSPARSCVGPSRSCTSRLPPTSACSAASGNTRPCTRSTTARGNARLRRLPAWWASGCRSSREGKDEDDSVVTPIQP